MNNCYLFIIWNKALFCKNRILNDLSGSFDIKKFFYIKWDKKLYKENLSSFYGTKAPDIDEKIKAIGNKEFMVIIVEDLSPIYEKRITYNGAELVNAKMYDKKRLYRKWTAGNFRIHGTLNEYETNHDLTILLGQNYKDIINKANNEEIMEVNTKGVEGFDSIDDFKKTISQLGDNYIVMSNNNLLFTYNRKNIVFFTKAKHLSNNLYSINVCNDSLHLYIFGEEDGDLPSNFINRFDEKLLDDFLIVFVEYLVFLKTRKKERCINDFFTHYDFNDEFDYVDTMRKSKKKNIFEKIINYIKYYLALIKSILND